MTMVYKPKAPVPTEAASPVELGVEREVVTLSWDGQTRTVTERALVIGRSREADVQVNDPNVSRKHLEIRQEGATYWVVDLESTNGTQVNGKRADRAKLEDGDRITIGGTDLVFGRKLP
jgi:pSer/pThr/pTyr-binding forkhead associated (FHA) protein